MAGLSANATTAVRKADACAAMLDLRHTGEDVLPLIVRLEERVKFAGQIRDDGITEYRAINFNGSLESMPPQAARALLHRLEGLREGLRSSDVEVETPVVLRGPTLDAALVNLPATLAAMGGESGWLAQVLRFRQFDRNLPALIGTLRDMRNGPAGEPIRFASADYDTLDDELVRADGTIEPARSRHVFVDHIAFRDDAGDVVWIFICRTYQRQPAGRQPRDSRDGRGDYNLIPNLAPEPVLVPVPVRVRK